MNFVILAILVVGIWLMIEFKRLKHKLFAIFLIGLIIFTYVSFTLTLRNEDVQLNSVSGIIDAGKLYFSWLGGVFGNVKSVTSYAVKQDWQKSNENVTVKLEEVEEDVGDIWDKI